jgi:hypothetical protein
MEVVATLYVSMDGTGVPVVWQSGWVQVARAWMFTKLAMDWISRGEWCPPYGMEEKEIAGYLAEIRTLPEMNLRNKLIDSVSARALMQASAKPRRVRTETTGRRTTLRTRKTTIRQNSATSFTQCAEGGPGQVRRQCQVRLSGQEHGRLHQQRRRLDIAVRRTLSP